MKKLVSIWIILLFIAISIIPYARQNYHFILANKTVGLTLTDEDRIMRLKHVSQLCQENNTDTSVVQTSESDILKFDNCYLNHIAPFYLITETTHIPAESMYLAGPSKSNQITNDGASLFSNGSLETLIYPSLNNNSWTISVETLHDDPSPVILEVWLDKTKVGELIYEKADKSWGTLSLPLQMNINYHLLQIKFINDFRDKEQGIDRNAYINQVIISTDYPITGYTHDQ